MSRSWHRLKLGYRVHDLERLVPLHRFKGALGLFWGNALEADGVSFALENLKGRPIDHDLLIEVCCFTLPVLVVKELVEAAKLDLGRRRWLFALGCLSLGKGLRSLLDGLLTLFLLCLCLRCEVLGMRFHK